MYKIVDFFIKLKQKCKQTFLFPVSVKKILYNINTLKNKTLEGTIFAF